MHTTININKILFQNLEDISSSYEVSTDYLVSLLIKKVLSSNVLKVFSNNSIRYQKRDPEKNWKTMHVSFDTSVYELGLDSRKFFKFSVSYIVSLGMSLFIKEIIKKLKKHDPNNNIDNYPTNYILIAKMFDNIQGFIIFWGVPEEKLLRNLIPT
jgi:hypothetical protein